MKLQALLINYFLPDFEYFILFPNFFPRFNFLVSITYFQDHLNVGCTFLNVYCLYRSSLFFYPPPDCYDIHLYDYLTLLSFILLDYHLNHFDLLLLSLIHSIYFHHHLIFFDCIFFAETFDFRILFYLLLYFDYDLFFDRNALYLSQQHYYL